MDKEPTEEDLVFVTESLGRKPEGLFTVVVRDELDNPRVIRNDPLLANGRPMPTLYWLVDPLIRSKIGTLESQGGVKKAEKEIGIIPSQTVRIHHMVKHGDWQRYVQKT